MPDVMNLAVEAMRHDAGRLERVAVNLANLLTPGFQREMLIAPSSALGGASRFASLVGEVQVVRDTRPGTLNPTGQPWDLALGVAGYFELQTPAGKVYSRRGRFQLDSMGRLATSEGYVLQGLAGDIRPGSEPARVLSNGQIRSGDRLLAQVKVVRFSEPEALRHLDAGYFVGNASGVLVDESRVVIHPGALENANVNQGQEMVRLMQTVRHFESMARLVQGYDEMLGGAVRRLGEN